MKDKGIDKFFFGIVIALLIIGVLSFVSASLGILAKSQAKFYGVLLSQFIGLGLGLGLLYIFSRVNYKIWRKYSFYIFLGSLAFTALVFVPGLGFEHGGAKRWISVGPISIQPVEVLKIGFLLYFAGWLSWVKKKAQNFKHGILPFAIMLSVIAGVLLLQPDTKNLILIAIAGGAMFFAMSGKLKHVLWIFLSFIIGLMVLVSFQPYLLDRVKTFVDPSRDTSGASYQINQSLIAIGSGGVTGRGLGQSIQKFSYLPEPQGDSIFAVIGEEWGFIGSTLVVVLFVLFALRGLRIAHRAPDLFARLLVTGIVILITAQSFLNIASTIGVFPLTGVPLVFISHGGTSLMLSLASIGIILNISKYRKRGNAILK